MSSTELRILRMQNRLRSDMAPAYENASVAQKEWLERKIFVLAMERVRKEMADERLRGWEHRNWLGIS